MEARAIESKRVVIVHPDDPFDSIRLDAAAARPSGPPKQGIIPHRSHSPQHGCRKKIYPFSPFYVLVVVFFFIVVVVVFFAVLRLTSSSWI